MPTRRRSTLPWVLAALCLVPACSGGAEQGTLVGTWERPLANGHSSLSIRETEDGYEVTWSKIDGEQTVRCRDDGVCEEFVGEHKVYEWHIRAYGRALSRDLYLEVTGVPVDDQVPALSYTDQLVLQPGGRELWSYMTAMDGVPRYPPEGPLKFAKVSEEPL